MAVISPLAHELAPAASPVAGNDGLEHGKERLLILISFKELIGWYTAPMDLEFSGELWFWKGPAPWHFVTVPEEDCSELAAMSAVVSYGWGMIPVTARIGRTEWRTSLWPKDGRYIVPVKTTVRGVEGLEVGDTVTVHLVVAV